MAKMKILHKISSLFLLLLCISVLALPVAATTNVEYDGLDVTVEMDKEEYEIGEPITATITVVNTTGEMITIINLEHLIPDGYRLSENSDVAMTDVDLMPGDEIVLKVTYEGDPDYVVEGKENEEEEMSFLDKVLYGQTWGLPNLLFAFLAVVAVVVFMILT